MSPRWSTRSCSACHQGTTRPPCPGCCSPRQPGSPADEATKGPGHPATFAIEDHTVATLTANAPGDGTAMGDPKLPGLPPGNPTATLSGMLLTETTRFTSR